jgi:Icc-related predicted phosphoesterase
MRILAIGDPHGILPTHINKIIKDNDIELVLCPGDFPAAPSSKYLWKYADQLKRNKDGLVGEESLVHILGQKKVDALVQQSVDSWKEMRKKIEAISVPVVIVYGNTSEAVTVPWFKDIGDFVYDISMEDWVAKTSDLYQLEYSTEKFGDYNVTGFGVKFTSSVKKVSKKDKVPMPAWRKKARIKHEKMLPKILSKDPRKTIMLVHEPPRGVLDSIVIKGNPRYGDHVGDELLRAAIDSYQPLVVVCGHIHEHLGSKKVGKTTVVNAGAKGDYAIIDIQGETVKVKTVASGKNKLMKL